MNIKEIQLKAFERWEKEGKLTLKRRIIRTLGSYFVFFLLKTSLTANQITVFSLALFFASGFFFMKGFFIFGILLMILAEMFDGIDGAIARIKNQVTQLQSYYLDNMIHRLTPVIILTSLGIGMSEKADSMIYLYCGFISGLSMLTIAFIYEMKNLLILKKNPSLYKSKSSSERGRLFVKNKFQHFTYELFSFPIEHLETILVIALLFNRLEFITVFYAVFSSIRTFIYIIISFRDIKKIESETDVI